MPQTFQVLCTLHVHFNFLKTKLHNFFGPSMLYESKRNHAMGNDLKTVLKIKPRELHKRSKVQL